MTAQEVWYRFEEVTHGTGYVDECGDWHRTGDSSVSIHVRELVVLKHTPKGVWLSVWGTFSGDKRFVLHSSTKRYACATLEEAKASFIARKKRQAEIHEARARTARRAQRLAETGELRKLMYGHQIDESMPFRLDQELKADPVSECLAIIQKRLPLYTELGQRNALRECISSIKGAFNR